MSLLAMARHNSPKRRSHTMRKIALGCVAVLSILMSICADDWPQFRGPKRDGVSRETGLRGEWPKDGPKLAWTFDGAGVGYSGPAVVGDRLYMGGGRDGSDVVFALD